MRSVSAAIRHTKPTDSGGCCSRYSCYSATPAPPGALGPGQAGGRTAVPTGERPNRRPIVEKHGERRISMGGCRDRGFCVTLCRTQKRYIHVVTPRGARPIGGGGKGGTNRDGGQGGGERERGSSEGAQGDPLAVQP